MSKNRVDITGMRFGRLTAVRYTGDTAYPCGKKVSMWECKCDCGKTVTLPLSALRTGNTKSCGCLKKEKMKEHSDSLIKHGDADSRLYMVWERMKNRCNNARSSSYRFYGAKGVSVCEEWNNDYGAFRDWALANGYSYSAKRGECTIDRINPYGNYEPNNCRWISMKEQFKNLRKHWKGEKPNA